MSNTLSIKQAVSLAVGTAGAAAASMIFAPLAGAAPAGAAGPALIPEARKLWTKSW